jgi:CheY-like chemotaxis protein
MSDFHGKILIIDDEDIIRNILGEMLRGLGYETVDFGDPVKAVEYYDSNTEKIGLVLLDMTMPNLSGRETFFLLKRSNRNVRVVILSGYSINDDIQQILNEGCLAYIKKPVKIKELEKVIGSLNKNDFQPVEYTDINNIVSELGIEDEEIESAVSNMGGVQLYIKMAGKYVDNYCDAGEKMKVMVLNHEFDKLFIFSHSLKSLVSSMGIVSLAKKAEEIERLSRENDKDNIADIIDDFGQMNEVICSKFKTHLGDAEKDNMPYEVEFEKADNKTILEKLNDLHGFAKKHRPVQIGNMLRTSLKNVSNEKFSYEEKEIILKKLNNYDFQELALYLEKLINKIMEGEKNEKI